MNCSIHTGIDAVAVCCDCGNGVCGTCRNKMFGRNYCDVCASGLEQKMMKRQAPQPPQVVFPPGLPQHALPPHLYKNPTVAAVLSAFIPGAGQVYAGRVGRGVGVFIGTLVLTPIFVGWFLWLAQIFDAHTTAKEHNLELTSR
ncbi:MAG: hypothetical protein H6744_06010 [Deltaproteobacteria bacterium]|nr:hypothetical protein [Deltaproteobacteria bacterium]MCB9786233.1 hypothetical protein [Deltaproteobacteria bacterium]